VPFVGAETPNFVLLPAAQRAGVPLPDLMDASLRRRPAYWVAGFLALAAGVLLGSPAANALEWIERHGVLPMHACSAMHWGVADAAAVLAMWCVMLAIMGCCDVLVRLRAAWRAPANERLSWWRLLLSCCADGAPAAFVGGHLAATFGMAMLLTLLNGALANAGLVDTNTALSSHWAGLWLIASAVWQLLPLQAGIVPRALLSPVAPAGLPREVLLRRGWHYGWHQAAAALPAMLALFALGIMNLIWMLLLLSLDAAEQTWPRHKLVTTRLFAMFWAALGIGLTLRS
jgi:Predicted metal-binding integral membrane protein (DUF2182)